METSMRTISQVAKLAGISIRTLQYYDEIGLLKPSALTPAGYRLYDDDALQKLRQILLFRELGFSLKDIRRLSEAPDYDQVTAFRRQKDLLLLKRSRIDRLIRLLDRLEKGETCMSFKEFDLSDYIEALERFKNSQTDEVIRHWGSLENYEMFVQKIRDNETNVAKLAISQYGSVENYTKAMAHNLEHFSELMEQWQSQIPEEMRSVNYFADLAAMRGAKVSSVEVQSLVQKQIDYASKMAADGPFRSPGEYCSIIIDSYSNDYLKRVFDTKQGAGSADFVAEAFRCYMERHRPSPQPDLL